MASPSKYFAWDADSSTFHALMYVNVLNIIAIEVWALGAASPPDKYAVSLMGAQGSEPWGYRYFNTQADAIAEANLWKDRAEAALS